ncbi:MAG: ribosomal protein S18-alanine N-acetyltransferase [Halieaceae bacterium]
MAETVRVRPALASDIQCVSEIEQQAAISPWSLSQLLNSSVSDNTHSLVLESAAGELLGFAIFQWVLDEATLMNVAVRPGQQGHGHGGCLMSALLQELRERGLARCLLEVRESNAAAIALYRKHGFVDDGRRKDYYPTPSGREDGLLMSCQVSESL